MRLHPADPTLAWEGLFGLPDSASTLDIRSRWDVLFIRGGNYLPRWFVDTHVKCLIATALAFNVRILLPLSRGVAECEHTEITIHVPSIKDVPQETLREYILWAIDAFVPDLRNEGEMDRSAARGELCELFVAHPVESRSRIEDDLEFYASTFDSEKYDSIVSYARDNIPASTGTRYVEPAAVLSKDELKAEFDCGVDSIRKLDEPFRLKTGYQLLSPTHEYSYPFDSSDPLHWFIGCVSYLGCLFFDAGKKTGLHVALRYNYDEGCGALVPVESSPFIESLRVLRTLFQHNLNPDSSDDTKTLAIAQQWFEINTGCVDPFSRQNARVCVSGLLNQFSKTVNQLGTVITHFGAANESVRTEMLRNMDQSSRTVAEHEVEAAVRRVSDELEINVSVAEVVRKYQDRIIKDIKGSACRIDRLSQELVRVCEHYCYEMARQQPRVGELLKGHGLSPREIGLCIEELNQEWQRDSTMTTEAYIAKATEKGRMRRENSGR
jgi:hypothetical protein